MAEMPRGASVRVRITPREMLRTLHPHYLWKVERQILLPYESRLGRENERRAGSVRDEVEAAAVLLGQAEAEAISNTLAGRSQTPWQPPRNARGEASMTHPLHHKAAPAAIHPSRLQDPPDHPLCAESGASAPCSTAPSRPGFATPLGLPGIHMSTAERVLRI